MNYPWIGEAIMEWEINSCRYEDKKVFCSECEFNGEICDKLSELAIIIADKIKEEDD